MSLICGRMSPLTTTHIYQLAIKAPRSASPSGKSPELHPYITSYASYWGVSFSVAVRKRLRIIKPFPALRYHKRATAPQTSLPYIPSLLWFESSALASCTRKAHVLGRVLLHKEHGPITAVLQGQQLNTCLRDTSTEFCWILKLPYEIQ